MARETIAVIEDEPDILEVIEYNLAREGYAVRCARDGRHGLDLVQQCHPDLLLLDLMLPGLDGAEVCRRLKAESRTRNIPIIMVTARGEESDVVAGLRLGADDYVAKPFSPRELIARVEAVLRRGPLNDERASVSRIVHDRLVIDTERHEVSVDGEGINLTATEFKLLHCLASRPGRVFTRDQLLTESRGETACLIDRNIDVHIRAIRKKFGTHRNLIETVRGLGYRFRDGRG